MWFLCIGTSSTVSADTNGTTPGPVLANKNPRPVGREVGSKPGKANKSTNGVRSGDAAGVPAVNGSVEDGRGSKRSRGKGRQAPIKESSSEDSDAPLVS